MTRFFRSTRKVLLSTIAAAVAATSISATPASAGNDDLAKALIGIGAIAIIGTALANESRANDRANDRDHDRDRDRYYGDNRHDQDRNNGRWNNGGRHNDGWQRPRPQPRKTVAAACEVRTYVNGYRAKGYRAACAENSANRPRLLPDACLQRTDVPRGAQGPKRIYRTVCMQRQGWVGV